MPGVLETYHPSKLLRPYVRHYLFPDISSDKMKNDYRNRLSITPSASSSLVLFFTEPSVRYEVEGKMKLHHFALTGYNTSPKTYTRDTRLKQMIVTFTPVGIQHLLDFSLQEISDVYASIETVFKKDHDRLSDHLMNATDNKERVALFEKFLIGKMSKAKDIDNRIVPLIELMYERKGACAIKELTAETYIGERTLQRLIHNYTGISYKQMSRLIRFEAAKELLQKYTDNAMLTNVAYELSYYDQAHFIHDFKAFSGQTPSEFMSTRKSEISKLIDSSIKFNKGKYM